jgi:hypothetical protein
LPDRRCHLVLGNADALVLQVFGPVDPGVDMDVDRRVAELARREDRDGDEREVAARPAGHVAAERHLGHVELLVHQHAPEDLFGPVEGDHRQVDPLGPHRAVAQRPHAVIVAASQV